MRRHDALDFAGRVVGAGRLRHLQASSLEEMNRMHRIDGQLAGKEKRPAAAKG